MLEKTGKQSISVEGDGTLYTIGYSRLSLSRMIEELQSYQISCVIDIRSVPYSRQFPEFNYQVLEKVLPVNRIAYRNYAEEFGARQNDPELYSFESYLDFEKFANTKKFLLGVQKVLTSMQRGYSICFLCAEHDPFDCHRSILVTRKFFELGYPIVHLIVGEETQSQQIIEKRLINKYFPDRDQLLLFEQRTSQELIEESYRRHNKVIGYRCNKRIP
jgi:hypothetical protein